MGVMVGQGGDLVVHDRDARIHRQQQGAQGSRRQQDHPGAEVRHPGHQADELQAVAQPLLAPQEQGLPGRVPVAQPQRPGAGQAVGAQLGRAPAPLVEGPASDEIPLGQAAMALLQVGLGQVRLERCRPGEGSIRLGQAMGLLQEITPVEPGQDMVRGVGQERLVGCQGLVGAVHFGQDVGPLEQGGLVPGGEFQGALVVLQGEAEIPVGEQQVTPLDMEIGPVGGLAQAEGKVGQGVCPEDISACGRVRRGAAGALVVVEFGEGFGVAPEIGQDFGAGYPAGMQVGRQGQGPVDTGQGRAKLVVLVQGESLADQIDDFLQRRGGRKDGFSHGVQAELASPQSRSIAR